MNKKSKKNETFTVKEVVILLVITCMANATIFFFMNIGEKESSYLIDHCERNIRII